MKLPEGYLPLRGRWLAYALWAALGFAWTHTATRIAGGWFDIINRLLHHSVAALDEQPLWGKFLEWTIGFSPAIVLGCLFAWSVGKKGAWPIPVAFLVGFAASAGWTLFRLLSVMRLLD